MTASQDRAASVVGLLREAARRFDSSTPIQRAARRAVRRGFQGGAEWMAIALSDIRGAVTIPPPAGGARMGLIKYGAAVSAAAAVVAIAAALRRFEILPVAVIAFYAVEARGAFVFPAFVDGAVSPWAESRALVAAAGGTAAVAWRTIVIAFVMVLGGLVGRGFLRSWCIGCLAVVLWYENLRQ